MTLFWQRIKTLIVKELLSLFRDPKGRLVLIAPPLMQLFIFAFAATLEVKNVSVIIYNQDAGRHGYELVQRITGSPTFTHIKFAKTIAEFEPYIDQQKTIAGIHIPQDFSKTIESGRQAKLQIIMDGRRSNSAQIVSGYLTQVTAGYGQEIQSHQFNKPPKGAIVDRSWFNENLLYLWFTVPSLVGILSMLIALTVTALSVARERELGTFDQMLVSPLMPYEILLGKMMPAVIIGLAEGVFMWAMAILVFHIPFTGSFLLLLFALFIFVMSVVGVGLFISALSKTQQQAILGTFIFMVPAITLSGYAAPIENMPSWLQTATCLNPLKYILVTIRGLFFKNMSFVEVWANTWPVLIIGSITLSLAGWFFSKRLG
ncbi:ABC transporter permease [Candidatus Finniella inopinata]|uniref:Transport permease protein n=1 Tax=Candidatus Finniella inopinata TaxID=1696036 RepID=A0A4Q7DK57_9PROT|nr:ABC transporter permease [Candidatus Finniella inopinata]RZI47142.1 ABC transporter permease [Candidatus Finniella inopinata]